MERMSVASSHNFGFGFVPGHRLAERGVVFVEDDGAGGGAGGVASTGDSGDAGAAGVTQTPGGANITGDGQVPAAGGQTAGGASLTNETALPSEFAEKFGVKTLGELAGFANDMRGAALAYRQRASELQQKANQTGNPQDQRNADAAKAQANAAEKKAFFGQFNSPEDYRKALETDYQGTFDQVLLHRMENNPAFADAMFKLLQPKFGEHFKPVVDQVQQQTDERFQQEVSSLEQRWSGQHDALGKADARFAEKGANGKPGELYGPLTKVLNESQDYVRHMSMKDPNFDGYRWAASQVLGQVALTGQHHSEQRVELANRIAGAAGPGTGGNVVPRQGANETVAQTALRLQAQHAAQGLPTMSEAELAQTIAAFERRGF